MLARGHAAWQGDAHIAGVAFSPPRRHGARGSAGRGMNADIRPERSTHATALAHRACLPVLARAHQGSGRRLPGRARRARRAGREPAAQYVEPGAPDLCVQPCLSVERRSGTRRGGAARHRVPDACGARARRRLVPHGLGRRRDARQYARYLRPGLRAVRTRLVLPRDQGCERHPARRRDLAVDADAAGRCRAWRLLRGVRARPHRDEAAAAAEPAHAPARGLAGAARRDRGEELAAARRRAGRSVPAPLRRSARPAP